MQSNANILYVEDDPTLSFITKENLELKGYSIDYFENGELALNAFTRHKYNLCILDVMLPKLDGFTLALKIREQDKDIPIIFLTAKSAKDDKITGLKTGADDYITKPFSIEELVLKIEVFLKRSVVTNQSSNSIAKVSIGNFTFDFENLLLVIGEKDKKLTYKEAELIRFLNENKNTILKREDILTHVWGNNDYFLGRSLDVFISRVRKYFINDDSVKIENIHGVGFRFRVK